MIAHLILALDVLIGGAAGLASAGADARRPPGDALPNVGQESIERAGIEVMHAPVNDNGVIKIEEIKKMIDDSVPDKNIKTHWQDIVPRRPGRKKSIQEAANEA